MRLNLFSQVITLLSLQLSNPELPTLLVHSMRLEETCSDFYDGDDYFMQSDANTETDLQSQTEADAEFLGMLASAALPVAG